MHRPIPQPNLNHDYQKFRPKYPLDPFENAEKPTKRSFDQQQIPKEPWRLNVDKLPPVDLTKLCRSVILVLGEHPSHQLLPLFKSQHFFSSLFIIAAHTPVYLPAGVFPTVRILKLNEPLDAENQGAERLVKTLEWAERVARVWRVRGGGGVSELLESTEMAQAPEGRLHKGERPGQTNSSRPRPSSSAPSVLRSTVRTPSAPPIPRLHTTPARSTKSRKGSNSFLPPPNPAQRGFDVLINFLPATGIPDGYLLKNVILVTTISRPFVIATSPEGSAPGKIARSQSVIDGKRGSRWSLFRQSTQRSTTSLLMPPNDSTSSLGHGGYARSSQTESTVRPDPSVASSRYTSNLALDQTFSNTNPALVIHILPSPPPHPHNYHYTQKQLAARDKLVTSIDSFLCAFGASQASYLPGIGKTTYDSYGSLRGDDKRAFASGAIPRARPYLVDGNGFGNDVLNATGDGEGEWSLAELLCCGCLDPNPPPVNLGKGKREHRVWISGISDIIISSSSASGSVGDLSSRSLTLEDEGSPEQAYLPAVLPALPQQPPRPLPTPPQPSYPQSSQYPSTNLPSPVEQLHVGDPIPVPQQQRFDTSSPERSFAEVSPPRSYPSFGMASPASPAPPPPPEKDYVNQSWDAPAQSKSSTILPNGYSQTQVVRPVNNYPYDRRPRVLSHEQRQYPNLLNPPIVSPSGTLNPYPNPSNNVRTPIPHNARPVSYPVNYGPSSPDSKMKGSRWKFWK